MKKWTTGLSIVIILISSSAFSDEITLSNGDKITGKIMEIKASEVSVMTSAMGEVLINQSYIEKMMTDEEIEEAKLVATEPAIKWSRKFSLGYSETGGNTEKNSLSSEVNIKRKTADDEWTAKWTAYLSRNDDKLDAKKFYGLGRYDQTLGDHDQWYRFYKFEASQDRFANVAYRLTPSAGIGHWFKNEKDYKLKFELAGGFEHTNYRDATKSENEAILVPRGYFEKKIYQDLKIVEDITLYPSLSEPGEYRLHSETSLINPISERVNLKISLIDDYDSSPSGTSKKNDYILNTSLEVGF